MVGGYDDFELLRDTQDNISVRTAEDFYSRLPQHLVDLQDRNLVSEIKRNFEKSYSRISKKKVEVAFVISGTKTHDLWISKEKPFVVYEIPDSAKEIDGSGALKSYHLVFCPAHEAAEVYLYYRKISKIFKKHDLSNIIVREEILNCNKEMYENILKLLPENCQENPPTIQSLKKIEQIHDQGFSYDQSVVIAYTSNTLSDLSMKFHEGGSWGRKAFNVEVGKLER